MKRQCIQVQAKGGAENLYLVQEDLPELDTHEVRVKIEAAGVSSADVLMREGVYPVNPPDFPFVPGYDIVGTVEACGSQVTGFQVGQQVAALTKINGYADYINLPAQDLVTLPEGVDPVQGVAVILNYITTYQILHRVAQVKAGEKILVYAAASGIGTAFLELGKLAGLEMYGTASARKHEIVKRLGAIPIDYQHEDVTTKINEFTGDGVDVALDAIGAKNCFQAYTTIKEPGRVVTFGASFALDSVNPNLPEVFAWWEASLSLNLLSQSKQVLTYAISTFKEEHHDWYREDLTTILNLLAEGKIKPVIAKTMPLSEARKAHELLDNKAVSGKIVLIP